MCDENRMGGIERYLYLQYKYINHIKFQYDFLYMSDGSMAYGQYITESNVYHVPERSKRPIAHYFCLLKFFLNIRYKKYDVLVINASNLAQAMPLLLARLIHIPVRIVHSHTSGSETRMNLFRKIQSKINFFIVNKSATDFWACSPEAGKYLFHRDDCFIVKNGIETFNYVFNADRRNKVRSDFNIGKNFVIGTVGRFSSVKNHLFLLQVFDWIHSICQNTVLLFAGDDSDKNNDYLKELKRDIKRRNLSNYVIFTGYIDPISDVYQAIDLFALPSFHEGFSFAALEAQAADLPCLVSEGVPSMVMIGDNIKRLSIKDMKLWGESILEIMESNYSRSDKSKLIINSGFDISTSTKDVEHYIQGKIHHE